MELILTTTLGSDWRQFFDFVIANASKPRFFSMSDRPFYEMDKSKANFNGKRIENAADLHVDSTLTYLEGNSSLLTEFLKTKLDI